MTADIEVAAPPEVPRTAAPGLLLRLLPVVISVATVGVVAAASFSGAPLVRNPTFVAFPMMMLVSLVVTTVTGPGRRRGAEIGTARVDYLGYLSGLRSTVAETAAAQRVALNRAHPDPDALWTLVGGSRMWERRPDDPEFCCVRVGRGNQPLARRLVAPQIPSPPRSDPVTVTALRRFLRAHSTIADVPVAIQLRGAITIDGEATPVRALLRAMICQLAVLHAPDQLLIAAVVSDRTADEWDWLKWLPHSRHPSDVDAAAPVRLVMIVDTETGVDGGIADAVTLRVGSDRGDGSLVVTCGGEVSTLVCPDQMDPVDAVVCARRLAACRVARRGGGSDWPRLLGIGEVAGLDATTLWRRQSHGDRLCAPIGATLDGAAVELDIKEPAEGGMGPHGLCVGATGSGKSELLRTVALGMMVRNSPEVLNLLLVDFKGGATFLALGRAPHVAAVLPNLADEAPLVSRMREALAGEMNRRQQLLRTAGNFVSIAAYEQARRGGARLIALPTLFVIVDEFSELHSQHPDFAETFVAIGRLGRSLGMHLLLASQRLDEGRLRGLEAHLSYRVCLKTLSASDSRTVLGTLDAYELPNTPGAGFLRTPTGELTRFQAALVSGPLATRRPGGVGTEVRPFTAQAIGPVAHVGEEPVGSVLHAVLDRLSGLGPPAHQVWLPPLEAAPTLDTLLGEARGELVVPIGIVDRPFDQSRTPLTVDLSGAAGNVAVVGSPRSGKSTALRTLIAALAATHSPAQVQFYCLDFGGGALASMRELPHVGDVAGRAEPELVRRMVAELESILRSREAALRGRSLDSVAHVFLVIDGWASLRHEFEALEQSITAIAAQGLSFAVHVVLSASRWAEIRPALKDQIGTRIELRLGDPVDSEVDRRQAQQVPRDKAGRGLCHDGLHMVIALPRLERVEMQRHGAAAPPIPLLPACVDYDTVIQQAGDDPDGRILLGLEERRLRPVAVDFERHPHLLVLGDNECGKTATLRTLCRGIVRAKTAGQARLLIVDFRRALLDLMDPEHVGGYAMSPAALGELLPPLVDLLRARMLPSEVTPAQLRTRSWWSGPDIYVVVDDYDLVATCAGHPLLVLLEYLPHARDLGLHVIVARRSGGAARAMFEPMLAGLRDFGCMALIMSGRPDEGALFGSCVPVPLPAGRGILITRPGDERVVQVAWSPPAP
ncbi:ESX secretion system protein EccC [Mycobacterium simulans]|uniref:type VII secretion protein EccCb n=1 Tax=Mycobacterium simulans TaxID=627089 RepID=UPI00174A4C72|nr:type VII secretion protein EccCb [Mycobacterium simulans]SON58747.1 ESX secretion system protein EccC [Mycobacterium simulans]